MLDVKEDTQKPRKRHRNQGRVKKQREWLYLTNNYLAILEKRFLSGLYIINIGLKIRVQLSIMTFDFTF